MAAVPVVNTRVLKRVEDLEREIPPIWCCGHWVLPKHLAQAVLGMDTMKRQRPLGLAVLLHWKGYLVVRDGGYGQGSIGPPQMGGQIRTPQVWPHSGGGFNPEKNGQWICCGFWRGKVGEFRKPHVL